LPAAAVIVGADVALTGALHLDGLADTADGLLAHVPTRDRLEIMAEPQVGTFAAVAVALALLGRAAALAALPPSPALLAAIYCSSRSVMVVASRALPYARPQGLAAAFLPTPGDRLPAGQDAVRDAPPDSHGQARGASGHGSDPALLAGVAGLAGSLALSWLAGRRRGAAALVAGWGTAAVVLVAARRRLGGFTGDVLGAAGVVAETTSLLAAALDRPASDRPPHDRRRRERPAPCHPGRAAPR
jgi:adenosylcobinamide-GDP ribazoletransferase